MRLPSTETHEETWLHLIRWGSCSYGKVYCWARVNQGIVARHHHHRIIIIIIIIIVSEVTHLPTKTCGRLLLVGSTLDQVKEYVTVPWATAGVINTAIVLADAEGNVASTECSLLRQHEGSSVLSKLEVKSLSIRIGYVKHKGSTY